MTGTPENLGSFASFAELYEDGVNSPDALAAYEAQLVRIRVSSPDVVKDSRLGLQEKKLRAVLLATAPVLATEVQLKA